MTYATNSQGHIFSLEDVNDKTDFMMVLDDGVKLPFKPLGVRK